MASRNETLFEMGPELAEDRTIHDRVWLGSAGWSYDDWEGAFYPPGTSSRQRLTHYASQFRSVEIDSTFYGIPRLATVQGWRERTPDDFVFAAKFPRTVTHDAGLVDCADEAIAFVERMTELGDKLGPLLIQLPPSYDVGHMRHLAAFLRGLPDGLAYAVEIRHRSWLTDEFAELLKRWNVALCLTCSGRLQRFWRVTSRFVYIRWLGRQNVFETFDHEQVDRSDEIDWWIPRIQHFVDYGGAVFGYVNNNYAGFSPATLRRLAHRLTSALGD